MKSTSSEDFWSNENKAREFAAREPDHRLRALAAACREPGSTRVLDIGCAGGRNTVLLAEAGFDVRAIDFAEIMVRTTRARLLPILGEEAAADRVRKRRMSDLSDWDEATFDWILALGVYQQAQSEDEWNAALDETARVLKPEGLVLVANFGPGTGSRENPPALVPGSRFLYTGFHFGNSCHLTAKQLDDEFARRGFEVAEKTETVRKETETGARETVNALYRKSPSSSS
ncbi:MAG: class I SAM-dependent methyltransferase [Gemmatimonadetes bacterium]|nr:class I SAM-dependent methyltransferase [Gemmatimonadota bacterium]